MKKYIHILLGATLAFLLQLLIIPFLSDVIYIAVVLTILISVVLSFLVIYISNNKQRLLNWAKILLLKHAKKRGESLTNFSHAIINKDVNKISNTLLEIYASFETTYLRSQLTRLTLIIFNSLFVLLGSLIGYLYLSQQNELIALQNNLVEGQKNRMDQQVYLQEAERQSSLVFLFSNIMDQMDAELRQDYNNDKRRNLSPQLLARIISLSQRLKPYKYLDGDTLSANILSPERGQLLINILMSELDSASETSILENGNFTYSDISGIAIGSKNIYKVDLSYSQLENVKFSDFIFYDSEFNNVVFKNCDADNLSFINSHIDNSILSFNLNSYSNLNFNTSNVLNTKIDLSGHISSESDLFDNIVLTGKLGSLNAYRSMFNNSDYDLIGNIELSDVLLTCNEKDSSSSCGSQFLLEQFMHEKFFDKLSISPSKDTSKFIIVNSGIDMDELQERLMLYNFDEVIEPIDTIIRFGYIFQNNELLSIESSLLFLDIVFFRNTLIDKNDSEKYNVLDNVVSSLYNITHTEEFWGAEFLSFSKSMLSDSLYNKFEKKHIHLDRNLKNYYRELEEEK